MTREESKSRMSAEERARRRAAVGKSASEKVAKSEQLNFRIEEQSITELQEMAFRKGVPVGTMIREWVLERLSQEKFGTAEMTGRAIHLLDEIHVKLNNLFGIMRTPNMPQPLAGSKAKCKLPAMLAATGVESLPKGAYLPGGAPCSLSSDLPAEAHGKLDERAANLEHLKAWEHLLTDQLVVIRHQLEQAEKLQK